MIVSASRFDIASATGITPILHWRTPNGIYRNASSLDKTVSVDVEAECGLRPIEQGGVRKVVFAVSVNGGTATDYAVHGRSKRTPNYSRNPSRQWYGSSTGPAYFAGYGITLDLSSMAGGTITVVATITTQSNETVASSTLTIYNDTDGVDRRPSTKAIYVSNAGSPTGAGTESDPVDTIQKALELAVHTPGGSTSTELDCGGANIYVLDGLVGSGGYVGAPSWHTSGARRVTVQAIGTDRTYRRTAPDGVFTSPDDYIVGAGFGGAGNANIEFVGFEVVGYGFVVQQTGTTALTVTDRDCSSRSEYWEETDTQPSVLYAIDGGGAPFGIDGTGKRYSWGHHRYGCSFGLVGYTSVYDFHVDKCLGVALQTFNDEVDDPCYTVGTVSGMRYKPGEVSGYTDTSYGSVVTGGANLAVTVPSGTQMRIDATNSTPSDFATELAALEGNTVWGCKCSGFTSGGNNGTFAVEETGQNGSGYPYVVLTNSSAVAETGGASARLETAKIATGDSYTTVVHPDVLQIQDDHDGAMFAHIRVQDCKNTRSWVGSGNNLNRCVFKNLTDGSAETGADVNAFDFAVGDLTNCLFHHLTIASDACNFDPAGDFTGTAFVDCVFGEVSDFPSSAYVNGCHFVSGSSYGIGATTGTWFAGDPSVEPWSFQPDPGNVGDGGNLGDCPAAEEFRVA